MINSPLKEDLVRKSFQVFDLPVHASKGTIKKRYKELAKIWHPDTSSEDNSEEKFKRLNDAYGILLAYKSQKAFVLKQEHAFLKKSEKDLKKEKYRKGIKEYLKSLYRTYPISGPSAKQSRKDFWLINSNFIFSAAVVIISPPLLTFHFGWEGLLLAVFLIVFLSLFIMSAIRNLHRTHLLVALKRFWNKNTLK